jgi:hypothetical protein
MTTARTISPLRLCASALIIPIAVHAAPVAIRWTAETSRPAPVDIPVFHGETLHIEPAFASYGTPLALSNTTAALYWQTNGMATAWWSVPAEIVTGDPARVRAIWSPTNDVGASRYTWFIATSSSNGASYRAYGTLMMRASPGATPAVLAAPSTLTDAMQAWADSRYDPAGTAQAASNALAAAVQAEAQARAAADLLALPRTFASTGTVNNAVYAENAVYAGTADYAWEPRPDSEMASQIAASIDHTNSPAAHPDIRAAIDAIPLPPTNVVAGWLVWDTGSNCYWRVSATNLRFYVWGVDP